MTTVGLSHPGSPHADAKVLGAESDEMERGRAVLGCERPRVPRSRLALRGFPAVARALPKLRMLSPVVPPDVGMEAQWEACSKRNNPIRT